MIPIRDNVRARRAPFATYALILANAIVFLHQAVLTPRQLDRLVHLHGVVPARLTDPAWAAAAGFPDGGFASLFTSMFIHGGWFHLISNMWALWLFGDNVEDRLGPLRYLGFYLLCGVIAMAAHVALNPGSRIPAVGASGAIAAVMGAYMLFYPFARMVVLVPVVFYPLFFEVPAILFLLLWIATQVSGAAASTASGAPAVAGVAFWAHVGGFGAGLLSARWWCPARRRVLR